MKKTLLTLIIASINVNASDLNIPNTFVASMPALAAEVNQNFNAVETAVDDNNTQIQSLISQINSLQSTVTSLQSTVTQLQSDLTAVENNTVLELDGFLMHSVVDGYDVAGFTGVNIRLDNGSSASVTNGLGNLIIGYNNPSNLAPFFCSDPQYTDSVNCIGNLHTWDNNVHTGSHYLVIGDGHSYTKRFGIISGNGNITNGIFAHAIGQGNLASGYNSSVFGGASNQATGGYSSVFGGGYNQATGQSSLVSGGRNNQAIGFYSTVSGGEENTATGSYSSVSGGDNRTAPDTHDWVAGSLLENN